MDSDKTDGNTSTGPTKVPDLGDDPTIKKEQAARDEIFAEVKAGVKAEIEKRSKGVAGKKPSEPKPEDNSQDHLEPDAENMATSKLNSDGTFVEDSNSKDDDGLRMIISDGRMPCVNQMEYAILCQVSIGALNPELVLASYPPGTSVGAQVPKMMVSWNLYKTRNDSNSKKQEYLAIPMVSKEHAWMVKEEGSVVAVVDSKSLRDWKPNNSDIQPYFNLDKNLVRLPIYGTQESSTTDVTADWDCFAIVAYYPYEPPGKTNVMDIHKGALNDEEDFVSIFSSVHKLFRSNFWENHNLVQGYMFSLLSYMIFRTHHTGPAGIVDASAYLHRRFTEEDGLYHVDAVNNMALQTSLTALWFGHYNKFRPEEILGFGSRFYALTPEEVAVLAKVLPSIEATKKTKVGERVLIYRQFILPAQMLNVFCSPNRAKLNVLGRFRREKVKENVDVNGLKTYDRDKAPDRDLNKDNTYVDVVEALSLKKKWALFMAKWFHAPYISTRSKDAEVIIEAVNKQPVKKMAGLTTNSFISGMGSQASPPGAVTSTEA